MSKRVFLIVLDSFGIGEAPDSRLFGDEGCNTLRSISKSPYFRIDNLRSMGFTHIDGLAYLGEGSLKSHVARLRELSGGKDTTIGHWEIAGLVTPKPLPTFPEGFPEEFIKRFSDATGRDIICNKTYSGTEVIRDYGEEHIRTGALICYTSADSVFQIAAHEDIVSTQELYRYCRIAREMLTGDLGVGRVIARPFTGEYPFKRTPRRHDFSLLPPTETLLDELKGDGYDVIGIGKIHDIFAGQGLTEFRFTESNSHGMELTEEYLSKSFNGICFTNLVDFDMIYGHRRDRDGYANAIAQFDNWLKGFTDKMSDEDILIITADHGCDPDFKGTDHTREYVPFIMYGESVAPYNAGTIDGYNYISNVIKDYLRG